MKVYKFTDPDSMYEYFHFVCDDGKKEINAEWVVQAVVTWNLKLECMLCHEEITSVISDIGFVSAEHIQKAHPDIFFEMLVLGEVIALDASTVYTYTCYPTP